MKVILIGIGAAGNKAVLEAINTDTINVEDTIIVNSTDKDFPKEYDGEKIILSQNNTGCGKERSIAKKYAVNAIKDNKFNIENIDNYDTVIICSSVEGGTGSGSTPLIAKYFNQVHRKNVHIIAFTGFEEDVRGLANTVEFFKEIDDNLIVQSISNSAFLKECGNNKFKAEVLANKEMCKRIRVLTGQDFIESEQNIDDTDILKVSNTSGYMTVEKSYLDKALVDQDNFNSILKKMIYNSKSIIPKDPGAIRIGVILNIDPASEDAIDFTFSNLKSVYGIPYESFLQKQWDENREYIAYIISGMQMPLDEIKAVYNKYKEETEKVNKESDSFFDEMEDLGISDIDKKFNMIGPAGSGTDVDSFLSSIEDDENKKNAKTISVKKIEKKKSEDELLENFAKDLSKI